MEKVLFGHLDQPATQELKPGEGFIDLRPDRVAMLEAIGSLLVGLFGALIAWRAGVGALSVKEAGESSAILAILVWIAQALMVPGFLLLAAAGFYQAVHLCAVALRFRERSKGA